MAPTTARATCRLKRGSALVVVLFLVILLTVLTVAFLSRSLTALRVSSSSSGETKAALMASSASDIVIGDLRQEIIAGSTQGTGYAVNWPVYTPNSGRTMIPFQNGIPTPNTTIPNLIRRSVSPSDTAGSCPYTAFPISATQYVATAIPPSRAATDSTAAAETTSNFSSVRVNSAAPSLNGRSVSLAQWNEPYLMSTTQLSSFIPPDWVIVTRAGATSVGWTGGGTTGLNVSTPTNTHYAIGRFAYTVYDEGGLLDMNLAGCPSGLTAAQTSDKSSLALADLTQIGLTQAQADNLVGWRNYASAELSGSYGAFSPFTTASAGNWLTNFVNGNTNGYMQITPPPAGVTTPPTDQAFVSRQQLISLVQSLGINTTSLQYMGTFSRALEQPSSTPDPNRPRILSPTTPPPQAGGPTGANEDNYLGNNDAAGGDDIINPPFLSIRVAQTFTRLNGTTAVVGEPLVKTKFALSRLAMVAYNATTSTAATTYGTASDLDPIYDRFGLRRTSASSPWTYNHGITNSSGQVIIGTLALVAAANREPDFAELLKAALVAGSLAKGGPNLNVGSNNYQYTMDTALDYQVLQIMANLIDQQDTDSYPTVIQMQVTPATGASYYRAVYGVEDLPYFYRYHLFSVVDQLPSPLLSQTASTITFSGEPSGTTTPPFTTIGSTSSATTGLGPPSTTSTTWNATPSSTNAVTVYGMKQGTLSNPGDAAYMYIVDLWNPHDMNTAAAHPSLRPTQYRLYATSQDPAGFTPQWQIGTVSSPSVPNQLVPETTTAGTIYVYPTSTPAALTQANTVMSFSDNAGTLFREPTLLWNKNPTGVNLVSTGSVTEVNTGKTYYGIVVGHAPISQQVSFVTTPTETNTMVVPNGNYVIQSNSISSTASVPAGGYQQITFNLQYLDASGNWETYDVKYPDLHGLNSPTLMVNTADYPTGQYLDPVNSAQFSDRASARDPRSARWGIGTSQSLGEVIPGTGGNANGNNTPFVLEPTANSNFNSSFYSNIQANNQAMGNSNLTVLETPRARADKGDQVNYSNPGMTSNPGKNLQMRIFSGVGFSASNGQNGSPLEYDGLFSQNNPAVLFGSRDNSVSNQSTYFEDADGVARRAMGAYASTTQTDASTSSLAQSPSTTPTRIGLPMATANTFNNNAVATATAQSQSRPVILNRPFNSVAEMAYAFTGTPWKDIDFSIPESGSAALLDTFCLTEPPANAVVAGKVDLNTRQSVVLQALVSGAYRDEWNNMASPPTYALPSLTSTEAANVAAKLVGITSDTTHAWRGPLLNLSGLVGRFVANPGSTTGFTDFYTYAPPSPVSGQPSSVTYAGLSAALDSTVYTDTASSASASAPIIERFREAAVRPLAAGGQVRVWNLLIDLVAQTGHYPPTASGLDQFVVEGQKHLWIHVAIDRLTGQVIDKQVEVVTQ